jgi:release factor glutamine methyltransferase
MRFLTLPGVFPPHSDCWLLASEMRDRGWARGARVLDLFTGSGALAVAAAHAGARTVVAVDVSRRAVLSARLNARRSHARVDVRRGDLWAPVIGERFDLILANPPYLPCGAGHPPARGAARAWLAGSDGRALLNPLCAGAPSHLTPGGTLLLVQSAFASETETLARLAAAGLDATVLQRQRGPLGPLMAQRADLLEARGLLAPSDDQEEMLVIAATSRRRQEEASPRRSSAPAVP